MPDYTSKEQELARRQAEAMADTEFKSEVSLRGGPTTRAAVEGAKYKYYSGGDPSVAGYYRPATDTVSINRSRVGDPNVMTHELRHRQHGLLGMFKPQYHDKVYLWDAFRADNTDDFMSAVHSYANWAEVPRDEALGKLKEFKDEFIEEEARTAYENRYSIPKIKNPTLEEYREHYAKEFDRRQEKIAKQLREQQKRVEKANAVDAWYSRAKERYSPPKKEERKYKLGEDGMWYDVHGNIVGLSREDVPSDWTDLNYNEKQPNKRRSPFASYK